MSSPALPRSRPPFWRDLRYLRALVQVLALVGTGFLLYILWFNLTNNLRSQGIRTDFGFLDQPVGVQITDSALRPGAPIRQALVVGVKNTLALVVVGLPLLTIIGVVVGVARLSTNWLAAKAAALFVEGLRNLPPLLIIIFVFRALILQLPPARSPITPFGWLVISNLRITVPGFAGGERFSAYAWMMAAALVGAGVVWWWRTRRSDQTGEPHHRVLWAGGLLLVVAAAGYLLFNRPFTISRPVLEGRVVTGGFSGLGGYFAVLIALVMYTASHVAEIVRGSIQAVPKGQSEAALALALSGFERLRYVVLPQAMRIALPPIINQYLNFTKNTSLALAVGYAEITTISFQAIGNGQPAPQVIFLLMAAYLLFSLVISFLVNVVNRRLQLVTR
jgi:general L-amino acid transport system permease protein